MIKAVVLTATEARGKFFDLLGRVAKGEEVYVTRRRKGRGELLFRLVQMTGESTRDKKLRKGTRPTSGKSRRERGPTRDQPRDG